MLIWLLRLQLFITEWLKFMLWVPRVGIILTLVWAKLCLATLHPLRSSTRAPSPMVLPTLVLLIVLELTSMPSLLVPTFLSSPWLPRLVFRRGSRLAT